MNEEYMKQLMDTVVKQRDQMTEQSGQIAQLIDVMKAMPGVAAPVEVEVRPAPVQAEVLRAEKVQKLSLHLHKGSRVKLFKADTDVLLYLKKYGEEITSLKQMVGIADALSRDEYVPIFRSMLDFPVIERLEQVFKQGANNYTWENISMDNLH